MEGEKEIGDTICDEVLVWFNEAVKPKYVFVSSVHYHPINFFLIKSHC